MATESNITHRVASLPLYRLPAEASFAMTLELTDYDPAGKYIELTAQSRYGRTASQVWRTATTDDTPAISISGSTVTIEIARARASVDEETLDFSDLGRNVAFAVVFRDSSSDPADFVLQGDLDFLPDRGDFDPGTAASTSVALTIATGSTVSVEVKGVIEGEAGAVTSVVGETGAVTASQIKTAYESLADTNAYTDAEKSKLAGIEASADVTDTANVTAAGALMDSEVTNLAQVKAFDSSDYATSAQGALADSAQQPPAEGAFVDGDKTKLDGIEAGADVTDTANVTAAGALMDSEVTNLAQVKAFDSSDYATSAQGALADSAVQPGDNVSDLTNDSGFISSVEGTAVLSTGETGGSKFLREDGDGTCSWQTIAGGGDMLASTYDPGSVSEQVVGLTATQTLTNKTLTTPTITLKQGTAPAPTAEGDIQWDTDDNQIKVGDGAATKVFSDDSQLATAAQGALADSAQQPPAEGAFVDGDKSKLDGIEAGADVTDTANVTAAGALMDSEVTNLAQVKAFDSSDYMPIAEPYYLQAALSVNGAAISAGTFKGFARVPKAGNITDVTIDCDPNNEPSAAAVQVDCNTVDRSTGAATSVLSAVASIATSGNTGSGTVNGTQAVSAGDLLSFDIDQGSDGKDLIVTVEITPT